MKTLKEILIEKSVQDHNVYRVTTMHDLLAELGLDVPDVIPIAVVLGPWGIFHKEIRDAVRFITKGDFYILPSSIHELICVNKKEVSDVNFLIQMVKDVNEAEVKEEDQLSDYVFQIIGDEVVAV